MGVFARGWWGCAFSCSRGCLRVLVLARLLGWWGSVVSPPPLPRLACLRAHAPVWALLACAVVLRAGLGGNGAGQSCPAPCSVACAASPAACAWGEKEGCGGPPGVVNAIPLLCSPTCERVTRPVGAEQGGGASGRAIVVWLGAVARGLVRAFWCVQSPSRQQRGQRAREGVVVAILVVALLPLGVWVMLGAWRFPLGGGRGVVVAIYVGSVKGGVDGGG